MSSWVTRKLMFGVQLQDEQARQAVEQFYSDQCDCLVLEPDKVDDEEMDELDYWVHLTNDCSNPYADISHRYEPGLPHFIGFVLTEDPRELNELINQAPTPELIQAFNEQVVPMLKKLGVQEVKPQLYVCIYVS